MTDYRIVAAAATLLATVSLPAVAQQGPRNTTTSTPGVATQQGALSDALVHKVGAALRQTATIRQKYSTRVESANTSDQKQALSSQAETELLQAISDQGLSVQQYNQVIQMAQADSSLKQRLLSVAQSAG